MTITQSKKTRGTENLRLQNKCPILDKRSGLRDRQNARIKFRRLLDYALSFSRQQDIAEAMGVTQGIVSKWRDLHAIPRHCNMQRRIDRLNTFILRRGPK